jgi:hypothetical protein
MQTLLIKSNNADHVMLNVLQKLPQPRHENNSNHTMIQLKLKISMQL